MLDEILNSKLIKNAVFYSFLLLMCFAFGFHYNAPDYDLWSRLIVGKYVIETHSILFHDFLSYIPTHLWIDPEWLSSCVIYLVKNKFSVVGLCTVKSLLIFVLLLLIHFAILENGKFKNSAYLLEFYFILLLLFTNTSLTYYLRCQYFTYIFFVFWLIILESYRKNPKKQLYFLPFVMLFWQNLHGGCISGIGILFLYVIGEKLDKKPVKNYVITFIFVLLTLFINPWGCKYPVFLLKSVFLDRVWISEWISPLVAFHHDFIIYFLLIFFTLFAICFKKFLQKKKFIDFDKTHLLIIFITMVLSISANKHIPLFVIAFCVFVYNDIYEIFIEFFSKIKLHSNMFKIKNIIVGIFVFLYSSLNLVFFSADTTFINHFKALYPYRAVEFLKINNIKGNLFSDFNTASFIAYKLYPNIKIYADGRQEQVYDYDFVDKQSFFIIWAGKNPISYLDNYMPDVFLLSKEYKSYNYIKKFSNYTVIYDDEKYFISIKNNLKKNQYKFPNLDDKKILSSIFDSNINFKNF